MAKKKKKYRPVYKKGGSKRTKPFKAAAGLATAAVGLYALRTLRNN